MDTIAPTLYPDDSGDRVANLQAALEFLLDRDVNLFFAPEDTPPVDELKAIWQALRVEASAGVFDKTTRALTYAFQQRQGLPPHLRGVVDRVTAEALNAQLRQLGALGDETPDYLVKGRITTTSGRPRPGLRVVAYDRDVRRHQRLGDSSTDAEGRYQIGYQIEGFDRAEGQAPLGADLVVVVLPEDGLEPLARSEVRFNATALETIDLQVPDWEPTEFERVTALVVPLLAGQGTPIFIELAPEVPADLQPHELNAEDVAFVVRETGLDPAAVHAWATGARWQHEAAGLLGADAPPGHTAEVEAHAWAFFFAWCRAGREQRLMRVLRSDEDTWVAVQRDGQALNRVPPLMRWHWRNLSRALTALAALQIGDDAPAVIGVRNRVRGDTYALATPAGRKPGTAGHGAARAYLEQRFTDLGLAGYPGLDRFRHEYLAGDGITMTNLIGVVPGADRALPPILIGAHYDSVIEAPCADDNAAAVAVMLAVAARVTAQPLARDVLVAAFDAEEPMYFLGPDMGSNRFVAEALQGPVHLAVILDLVGHPVTVAGLDVDPDLVFVTGAESHPVLPGVLTGLDLPITAVAQTRVGDFSDYAAFRQAGAPYLFLSCGEWAHYHQPTDHPDLLDYWKMARLVGYLEQALRRIDSETTHYHASGLQTEFEVATIERAFGATALTALAAKLGRPGYRTSADLDAIIASLRGQLR